MAGGKTDLRFGFSGSEYMEIDGESYKKAVEDLSDGLLENYAPTLKLVQKMLIDLNKRQENVGRTLHAENWNICEATSNPEAQEIFERIKYMRAKLVAIKQTMTTSHEKVHKLKARVLKLEQNKQTEAKYRAQQRAKEEQLIGKLPST